MPAGLGTAAFKEPPAPRTLPSLLPEGVTINHVYGDYGMAVEIVVKLRKGDETWAMRRCIDRPDEARCIYALQVMLRERERLTS